jgi:tRNA (guanine37-N1)-methyltransferase
MNLHIITVLPELFRGPLDQSIVKRAQEKGLVNLHIENLRDFGIGKYKSVDDYPYGGGGGMVMRVEPLAECIEHLLETTGYDEIIYLTPDGVLFNQGMANELSLKKNLLLICGHYKGIDQRIRDTYVTREISVGDYVLSGGELPAMVLCDALIRLLPGVLSDETSALTDSFQDNLLAPPVYTRPEEWRGLKVPEVLLSGNDRLIADWRHEQAAERTRIRRPDISDSSQPED